MYFKEYIQELYSDLHSINVNKVDKDFYFKSLNQLELLDKLMQQHKENFEMYIYNCASLIKSYSDKCSDRNVKNGLLNVSCKLFNYFNNYKCTKSN